MAYNAGEIYFIRERDRTGLLSPFVKIGLVRYVEGRDSFTRLGEHQTGNPRQLVLDAAGVVKTPAVDRVEALLHAVFAESRVSGEWFEFVSDDAITKAIEKAREFAGEMEMLMPMFDEAAALQTQPSDGSVLPPTAEDALEGLAAATGRRELKIYESLQRDIREVLQVAVEEGREVGAVATSQVRQFKPRFDASLLREDRPTLWEQFQVAVTTWDQRFLIKVDAPPDDALGDECLRVAQELEEVLARVRDRADVALLNEPILRLRRAMGRSTWSADVSSARLKVRLGTAEAIEGVCSWKRKTITRMEFDEANFAAAHPKLALRYVSEPQTRTFLVARRTKAASAAAKPKAGSRRAKRA